MDESTIKEIFKEIKNIAIAIAIMNTKLETKEKNVEECMLEIKNLDIRVKLLEKYVDKTDGASANSISWKDTLYRGMTIGLTIISTAIATVGIIIAVMRLQGG